MVTAPCAAAAVMRGSSFNACIYVTCLGDHDASDQLKYLQQVVVYTARPQFAHLPFLLHAGDL